MCVNKSQDDDWLFTDVSGIFCGIIVSQFSQCSVVKGVLLLRAPISVRARVHLPAVLTIIRWVDAFDALFLFSLADTLLQSPNLTSGCAALNI